MRSCIAALTLLFSLAQCVLAEPPKPGDSKRSLTLQECYRQAIDNSHRLAEIRSRYGELNAKVDEAYTQARPSAEFGANVTHQTPTVSFAQAGQSIIVQPADSYLLALTVRQALFTFGRLHWAARAAELNRLSGAQEYRREAELIFAEVATSYHDARLAERQVDILRERLQAQEVQLRDSESLYRNGSAAKFDVLRSQAELSRVRQQLVSAQNEATSARDRLLSRLGQPLGLDIALGDVEPPPPPPADVEPATQQALARRPELEVLQWTVEAAQARVHLENSQDNPRLDAVSQVTQRTVTGFAAGTTWTTGLSLTIPLYDGGISEARMAQAQHVVDQLKASLENSRRSVRLEVRETWLSLRTLWEKRLLTQTTLEQAHEALRVARVRYQAGISTQVELLNAQTAYSEAQFAEAQNWHDYQLAWARWRRVISDEHPAHLPPIAEPQ